MSQDLSLYRPNVGVVLFNRVDRVWLGQRVGSPPPFNWQFPQGGVDEGEALAAAALRELFEETGVRSATLIGRTPGWLTYDFPPEAQSRKILKGWKGQKQVWFAARFEGEDEEVRLDQGHEVEFDAWRWATLDEALASVVPFKRQAYEILITSMRRLDALEPL